MLERSDWRFYISVEYKVGLEDGLPVEVYKYVKYSFFMIVLIDDIWENFKFWLQFDFFIHHHLVNLGSVKILSQIHFIRQ